jgi:peptidoglycan hydrolase-like protein with peptidoglycan-binding domain
MDPAAGDSKPPDPGAAPDTEGEEGQGRSERPPWHDVPIYEGRDLASDELWELSAAIARTKRRAAQDPPRLPKARRASVSLVVAAVAAATPVLSAAHPGSAKKPAAEVSKRGLLKLGDRGPAVAQLQRALGITADGIFGRKTLKAVRALQKREGLAVDGIVGSQTLGALERTSERGRGGTLELGGRGPAVARLQRALGIPADGIFGQETLDAVRALQKREGLVVDGIVGSQTRAALEQTRNRAQGGTLELGDRGRAVARLQRALGIPADGIFGPNTLEAVRALQKREGLAVDGIAGSQTLAALEAGAASEGRTASDGQPDARVPEGVDERLGPALALAREMGLKLVSAHRPGATIGASGGVSDHAFYPSKAIDLQGSADEMQRYALAVAGLDGVETVIYAGAGMWIAGQGWGEIRSEGTRRDHVDHVHVDTF